MPAPIKIVGLTARKGKRRAAIGIPKPARRLALLLLAGLVAAMPARAEESVEAALGRQLTVLERQYGKVSPSLLPVLDKLARARWQQGDLAAAAALRRRALGLSIAVFGRESVRTATAMAALAQVYLDRRRHLDAEPLLILAARVLRQRAADSPALAAAVSAGLARVALARGKSGTALASAARAVEIARRDPRRGSAEPLRALGAALTAERRFDEAQWVLGEAVALDAKQHGAEAAETARSLSQLANLHLRRGRATTALPLIQQATAIDQLRLGPAHPFIADDLHDLGVISEALNRLGEARRAFGAAIAVLERGDGRDTPRVAYAELELSRLYRRQGDDAAADAAFRDARRILNKAEAEERRRERRT